MSGLGEISRGSHLAEISLWPIDLRTVTVTVVGGGQLVVLKALELGLVEVLMVVAEAEELLVEAGALELLVEAAALELEVGDGEAEELVAALPLLLLLVVVVVVVVWRYDVLAVEDAALLVYDVVIW